MITRSKAAFAFIFITVLLDMISFGIIIPVFPQLILKLQGGDMAGAAAIFGIFGTAFAAMQPPYLLAAILMAATTVLVMRSAATLRSPAAARPF